jgi:hypothetical protein
MAGNKKRYLGLIVLSDDKSILRNYTIDAKGFEYKRAKKLALRRFRRILTRKPGMHGVLFEVGAFNEGETVYSSDKEKIDPNYQSHEAIHSRIHYRKMRENWQVTMPLEESIAYAYGDYVAVNESERSTPPKDLSGRILLGKHSMRLMQYIDHGAETGVMEESLKALLKDADPEYKNIAWALDAAANYLFYRECLRILEQYGPKDGLSILFDSIKIANELSLEKAWLHMLCHLKSAFEKELVDEVRFGERPIIIRSPYAPECEETELILRPAKENS